jgi:hypothetical protein
VDEDLVIRMRYMVRRMAEIAQESDQVRQRLLQSHRGCVSDEASGPLQEMQPTPMAVETERSRPYVP